MSSTWPDNLIPRALPRRVMIAITVTPIELQKLLHCLEDHVQETIERGQDGYPDHLLCRCAELREAAM